MHYRTGKIIESLFIHSMLERGYNACLPILDEGYDVIITNDNSNMYRVQVKSTACLVQRKYKNQYQIGGGSNSLKRVVDNNEADIIAVYISPVKVWYFLPCSIIQTTKLTFNKEGISFKYYEYKDNWSIFDQEL